MDVRQDLFWPVPRTLMNDGRYENFRSLLAYQLLFGGRLLIRDADYLTCRPLRAAMRPAHAGGRPGGGDQFIAEALDRGDICLVGRNDKDLAESLSLLPETAWRGANAEWIGDRSDLDRVQRAGAARPTRRYSVAEAGDFYTAAVLRFLGSSLAPHLHDALRQRLLAAAETVRQRNDGLRWADFAHAGAVWSEVDAIPTDAEREFVYAVIGQAPHAAFIPHAFDVDPIYMSDAADAVALWRGRLTATPAVAAEQVVELGAKSFALADYAECLSALSYAEVFRLYTSDEAVNFFARCAAFGEPDDSGAQLIRAFYEYRRRIDEAIARTVSGTRAQRYERVAVMGRSAIGELRDETINLVVQAAGAYLPLWKLGLSLFKFAKSGETEAQSRERRSRTSGAVAMVRLTASLQSEGERFQTSLRASAGAIDREVSRRRGDLDVSG